MRGYVRRSLAICVLCTSLGCGGGPTSPSAAPTPDPFPHAGTWSSPSGSSQFISFTVTQNQVTALALGYSELILIPPATFTSCPANLTLVAPVAITGNAFAAQVRNASGTTTVRGTFASGTSASGTFDAWRNGSGSCDGGIVIAGNNSAGTWQAMKQ